jgi:hypothetical protein
MSTYRNRFGQEVKIGDVVGWGHRSGNMSHQHVGLVLEVKDQDGKIKTTCAWVDGPNTPRRSATTDQLFVLDVNTLSHELYSKIVQTAARIVEEQAKAEEADSSVSVEA